MNFSSKEQFNAYYLLEQEKNLDPSTTEKVFSFNRDRVQNFLLVLSENNEKEDTLRSEGQSIVCVYV